MSYTVSRSISTIDEHKVSPACTPQPLPAELQPFWDMLLSHSQQKGYAWAKIPYLMKAWDVARWKVYEILNKLRDFGRLVAVDVKKSHERRFYLFSPRVKRNSNEVRTKKTDSLYRPYSPLGERQVTCADAIPVPVSATLEEGENAGTQAQAVDSQACECEPSPSRDSSEPKSEKSIAAQLLSRGVWPQTVPWIVANVPEKQIIRAIEYFDIVQAFRKIEKPGAYLKGLAVSGAANGLDMSQVGVKAKPEGSRRVEAVRAPRPDKSTMYHQFTEAELNGEDLPVKAAQRPVKCPVERSESKGDPLAGLSPMERRRRLQATKGVTT